MRRKLVSMLLVLNMILGLLPIQAFAADSGKPVDTANPFEDVQQGSWYYDAVQYVRVNGMFYGSSKTTFRPEGTMTRGMFVTVLGRMAGVNPDNYTGPSQFTDVPETAFFAPYVGWAAKYGITVGTGGGKFSPNASINRQQMAVFFVRYFEAFDVDYETGDNVATTPADFDSVSPWAKDAVLKLWRQGLLAGSGGKFRPLSSATRAQAASVCFRTDEAVAAWYSEPGVLSARVRINPATGLPYDSRPSGGGSGSGGSGGSSTPSDSWSVRFLDGSRLIKSFNVKKGEALGQVPTVAESSKAGYILEGYYTDSNFTTPFYAENPVTGNLNVYARYESMGDAETLTLDSFARMDQQPEVSFRFQALDGTADTPEAAKAAVSLAVKDGSDPVKIEVSGSGVYTVSAPDGFNPGCSYELNLAEGWTFLPDDGSGTIPSEAIRTAAFSIRMEEVENLSMNSGIRYVQDTDRINYTYTDSGNKTYSGIAYLPSNADIKGGGSFNYSDTTGWQNGDILCIYVGGKPDDGDDKTKTEEAIYAKVSGINDNTVNFVPLETEDQARLYDIPDNFPIKVDALPNGTTGTVSITALDTATYALMVNTGDNTVEKAKAKLGVGDFVTLYVDSENTASEADVYFGKVAGISGDTITYVKSSAEEIEDSANLYKSVDVKNTDMITPAEQAEIQHIVQAQVERSGFAEEAAYFLADLATQTEGFRRSMGVMNFTAADEDGNPLSDARLASYAGLMELDGDGGDDGVEVKVAVVLDPNKLHFGSKGVQLAVQVDAEFKVEAEDGEVHFDLSATFVQEAAVDPKVKGELVYKKILKIIPVPTGVQVNAIVDVKSYTAMSLRADVYTVAEEEQSTWEKFKAFTKDPSALADIPGLPDGLTDGLKTVGEAIDKIEDTKAKIDKGLEDTNKLKSDLEALWSVVEASAQNGLTKETYESACETLGKTNVAGELMDMLHLSDGEISTEYVNGLDALMDKYSELLEKETDWVQLVDAKMFDTSTPPEFGVMVGVEGKFVVRADVNIALGSNLEYEVGKRYNFWFRVGLFKPTFGSSTMDLIDEHFAFQFYVMGKLGLKAGVRLKVYAAIGSVDAVSVGITTELGPYVKLWGFFIYDYSKYRPANTQKWVYKEQMAGALYLEFGLYLMVGMEAKALFLEFDKDFVDKEFPLLEAGDREYYYGMDYESYPGAGVRVNNSAPADGYVAAMPLADYYRAMRRIDLTTGVQSVEAMDYDQYIFQLSNPNFELVIAPDNKSASIRVKTVPEGVRYMECDLTITYKYGKMAFSTFDMSTTVHLVWTNMDTSELMEFYTVSVRVPDAAGGGYSTVWSQQVRKSTPFDLPDDAEIKKLLSWSDAKYLESTGYGSQQTKDLTVIRLRKGDIPDTASVLEAVPDYLTVTGFYPAVGAIEGDMTYQVVCEMPTGSAVTVSFEPNGGSAVEAKSMPIGSVLGALPTTSRTGYSFDGWYSDEALTQPVDANTQVTEPMTLYAKWTANTITVTFNVNGGDSLTASSQEAAFGSAYGELPVPTRTDWRFDGWFTEQSGGDLVTAETVVAATENQTLYAHWTEMQEIPKTIFNFSSTTPLNIGYFSGGWRIKSSMWQLLADDIKDRIPYEAANEYGEPVYQPEEGAEYTFSDFTITYKLQEDTLRYAGSFRDKIEAAGTYTVKIVREAGGLYKRFEATYDGAIVVDRVTAEMAANDKEESKVVGDNSNDMSKVTGSGGNGTFGRVSKDSSTTSLLNGWKITHNGNETAYYMQLTYRTLSKNVEYTFTVVNHGTDTVVGTPVTLKNDIGNIQKYVVFQDLPVYDSNKKYDIRVTVKNHANYEDHTIVIDENTDLY